MKAGFNKHFGFSKGEFNGLLVLIFLIIGLRLTPIIYSHFETNDGDDAATMATIQRIALISIEKDNYTRDRIEASESKIPAKLFSFDPNTIDASGWQSLGLSVKQAQSIVNYRNKGGKFYKAEDLQKMYTISPQMYQKLLPYVQIDDKVTNGYTKKDFQYEKKEYTKKALVIVEINQADSAQLDEIKGIGGAFAMRILKYRERIGGFYKKEQLKEVFGLDSVKYEEIKAQITINADAVKKININTATFNDLKSSPYLSYKQMNAIIQYRKQHGNFASVADLQRVAILTPQVIEKISPYLLY
ncbi:hypothetical protein EZJ43_05720 [Pedobacter changchengzhani]|uniref:Helix-hairpin-helix domain-containing protein n=1 Tax=Pedobacter changchengzhani TaxID=2529274 RepID=A0A4R5MM79_9SPHI|nr:helix-hairpin-helix domain-containing protein [Pedobacter changchengzhani]TDG36784.1 hypothetical protein EZJ43_05720 [Pedobacter changchengzhani]